MPPTTLGTPRRCHAIDGMSNLAVFKRIVTAAVIAGILAGSLLTVIQQIHVVPALLEAEVYEAAADRASSAHAESDQHADEAGGRTLLSAVSNVSLAIGFALLLGASMHLSGRAPSWRSGLLWGLAGYAVFFVAPTLGLPPEVPGTEAARLIDRQVWWVVTVLCTAVGLSWLVFARPWAIRIAGVVLLAVPHLIGAPNAMIHSSTAPAELVESFIYASVITNLVFWLALGGLLGSCHKKLT